LLHVVINVIKYLNQVTIDSRGFFFQKENNAEF
jgi:hypothetical protein